MAKKEKIITVTTCDFCIREDYRTWECGHCGKDACNQCGAFWEVKSYAANDNPSLTAFSTIISHSNSADFIVFMCSDCSKNQLPTPLLQFGFKSLQLTHGQLSVA